MPARPRPSDASTPARIQDVLLPVLRSLEPSSQPTVDATTWRTVAGTVLAAHSAPAAFKDGRLTVHVEKPGHLFLLHLKRRGLLQALQQRLGPGTVKELRFRAGALP